MSRLRLLLAAALLPAAAACSWSPTALHPADIAGSWHAAAPEVGTATTRQWLELRPAGRYTWTTESYGPGGRPEDGLLERFSHVGEWEMRGPRLALRTLSGMGWSTTRPGGYQADFVGAWDNRHTARIEAGRLLLTFEPRPEDSSVRRTISFERTAP